MGIMQNEKFLHILRNPYGYTKEEVKQAGIDACNAYESAVGAYKNMSDFAEENGLNVTADGSRR